MVELTAKPRTSILLIKITCYFLVYHSFVLHKRGYLIKVHKYFTTLLIYISITLRLRTCNSEQLGNHHYLSLGASPWQIILSASCYVYTNYGQSRISWEERAGRYRLVTLRHLSPGEVEKDNWSLWGMVGAGGWGWRGRLLKREGNSNKKIQNKILSLKMIVCSPKGKMSVNICNLTK